MFALFGGLFGQEAVDLGCGLKMDSKLKCVLCLRAGDQHRFSRLFDVFFALVAAPFLWRPHETAPVGAGSWPPSVTAMSVGNRPL